MWKMFKASCRKVSSYIKGGNRLKKTPVWPKVGLICKTWSLIIQNEILGYPKNFRWVAKRKTEIKNKKKQKQMNKHFPDNSKSVWVW